MPKYRIRVTTKFDGTKSYYPEKLRWGGILPYWSYISLLWDIAQVHPFGSLEYARAIIDRDRATESVPKDSFISIP